MYGYRVMGSEAARVSQAIESRGVASTRPRILVLTPRFPYPVIGGDRLRIFRICEALSREVDIDLISLCETEAEMSLGVPDDGVFSSVQRVLLPRWRSWLNCGIGLFSGAPLQVAYYRSAEFESLAREGAKRSAAVLAHLIRTAEAARNLDVPKLIEMTDAISLNYERSRQHFNPFSFRSLLHLVESRRVGRYECEIMGVFDLCVFVSAIDRQYLVASRNIEPASSTMVCTNGVDSALHENQYVPDGKTIIFIGNQSSYQNADAVRHFVREIFPLVLEVRPDARFRIIGRIDRKQRDYLSGFSGVDVTGEVPDVGLAASGATVGVCPVRIGAGVQNKLLEYMALGVPAVTTSVGLEGLEAVAGADLLVADSPSDFAKRVGDLLDDRGLASALSRSGRKYVAEKHSWDHVLAPLKSEILGRLVRGISSA